MNVSELLKNCCVEDSQMLEFVEAHPKQIIGDMIDVPIWKILYKYTTKRNNDKSATKYIILDENSWDLVETKFNNHITEINEKHPERAVSNVEILEAEFLGKVFLNID